MLSAVLTIAFAAVTLALLLDLHRLFRGPTLPDRVMAVDNLSVNTVALLVLGTLSLGGGHGFFEAALLIAVLNFIGTVAFARHLMRGDPIR